MVNKDIKSFKVQRRFANFLTIVAWISLLAAFIYGKFFQHDDFHSLLMNQSGIQNISIVDSKSDKLTVITDDSTKPSNIRFGKAQGYGGELVVGVKYDTVGIIEHVYVLKERETFSFIAKLSNKRFFEQFSEKKVNDAIVVGDDIDAVSGCTVSSVGFTNAIRNASYDAARKDFDLYVSNPTVKWQIGINEIAVLALIVIGILALYMKKKWFRYIALAVSIILVGFHLNASLSISHFARLMLGFLPNLQEHFIWWILVSVSIAFPFFLKKNLYCYALCPFHAIEILLINISGFQLKLTRGFQKASKIVSLSLLWIAFMLIFLSENPTLGSYEPFALLFSLDGAGLQWYLLPAALIGAMLVPDFYCRYFCPVGRTFKLLLKAGNKLREFLSINKKSEDSESKIRPLRRLIKKAS